MRRSLGVFDIFEFLAIDVFSTLIVLIILYGFYLAFGECEAARNFIELAARALIVGQSWLIGVALVLYKLRNR